jgi:hypothetical protein
LNGSWIISIVLLTLLVLVLPYWKYSKPWGFTPAAWLGLMIVAHAYTIATSA